MGEIRTHRHPIGNHRAHARLAVLATLLTQPIRRCVNIDKRIILWYNIYIEWEFAYSME